MGSVNYIEILMVFFLEVSYLDLSETPPSPKKSSFKLYELLFAEIQFVDATFAT